jgi:hypothetical protein
VKCHIFEVDGDRYAKDLFISELLTSNRYVNHEYAAAEETREIGVDKSLEKSRWSLDGACRVRPWRPKARQFVQSLDDSA